MEMPMSPIRLGADAALPAQAGLMLKTATFTPFRAIAWLSMAAAAISLLMAAALSLIVLGIGR
jgi:hypothetical protein